MVVRVWPPARRMPALGGWRWRRRRLPAQAGTFLLLMLALVVGATPAGGSVTASYGVRRPLVWAAGAHPEARTPVGFVAPLTAGRRSSTQGCVAGQPPAIAWTYPVVSVPPTGAAVDEVALTFDDGPSAAYTPAILAALRNAGAQATFFVIGAHARAYPDLIRQERADGDAIGNHTFDHPLLSRLTPDRVSGELSQASTAIGDALDDRCVWLFRPPYGVPSWSAAVAGQVRQAGLLPVLWSVDAADWLRPGTAVIAARIIARLRPGAIILLHDGAPDSEVQDRSQTVAALPLILAALRARGLHAVTLPQLLFDAGVIQQAHAPPAPTLTPGPGE